jgi:hypothetical protein
LIAARARQHQEREAMEAQRAKNPKAAGGVSVNKTNAKEGGVVIPSAEKKFTDP